MKKTKRARRQRRGRVSIRWKTLSVLGVFALTMIGLLWLFQIVLLDDFYIAIKKNAVSKTLAEATASLAESEDYASDLDELAMRSDVCISVLDDEGNLLYRKHVAPSCIIHNVQIPDLIDYYLQKAEEPGDLVTDVLSRFTLSQKAGDGALQTTGNEQWHDSSTTPPAKHLGSIMQSMLCFQFVENAQGQTVLLMVNATLTPVSATVQTLRLQLSLVTVLLAVLATALAFYLSDRVSKPIISISREAEKLGHGDFDAHFSGTGYLEAAQLADTLNYAAAGAGQDGGAAARAHGQHLPRPAHAADHDRGLCRDDARPAQREHAGERPGHRGRGSAISPRSCDDILDLSKLESGVQEMNPEPLNLHRERARTWCSATARSARARASPSAWRRRRTSGCWRTRCACSRCSTTW